MSSNRRAFLESLKRAQAPAIDRESMTLTQIYKAGEGAGQEATGVYAVWMEGRGERVIDAEGYYVGMHAVSTPWPLRGVPLENEALPQAVYDAFKVALGRNLEQALARVYALGREQVS
jgi:hypothetical protein